jgi:hypothetical protein
VCEQTSGEIINQDFRVLTISSSENKILVSPALKMETITSIPQSAKNPIFSVLSEALFGSNKHKRLLRKCLAAFLKEKWRVISLYFCDELKKNCSELADGVSSAQVAVKVASAMWRREITFINCDGYMETYGATHSGEPVIITETKDPVSGENHYHLGTTNPEPSAAAGRGSQPREETRGALLAASAVQQASGGSSQRPMEPRSPPAGDRGPTGVAISSPRRTSTHTSSAMYTHCSRPTTFQEIISTDDKKCSANSEKVKVIDSKPSEKVCEKGSTLAWLMEFNERNQCGAKVKVIESNCSENVSESASRPDCKSGIDWSVWDTEMIEGKQFFCKCGKVKKARVSVKDASFSHLSERKGKKRAAKLLEEIFIDDDDPDDWKENETWHELHMLERRYWLDDDLEDLLPEILDYPSKTRKKAIKYFQRHQSKVFHEMIQRYAKSS